MKLDVCVATYRRPQWLGQLLAALARQQTDQPLALRVIVVDNDPACSAREVVQAFPAERFELLYLTQPQKNIALTRNMALEHCAADWVAFVDDDESVPPHWLQTLLGCQRRFDADAVFGPVEGIVAAAAPAWVRRSGYFGASRRTSGSVLAWGSTNNALLRGRWVAEGARFDPQFGITGGEDTDFFYRLGHRGARMVWCQEALVTEHVPLERSTLRWMLQRNFRGGQSFADIVSRPPGPLARLRWGLRQAVKLAGGAVMTLLTWPVARLRAGFAVKAAASAGELSTLFRFRLQEYR